MIFFRKLHKWLGLAIGVQLVIWLISGMLISFIDQQNVSGRATRLAVDEGPPLSFFDSLFPASQLPLGMTDVQSITLNSFLSSPVYRVVQGHATTLFDGISGKKILIDRLLAEQIALNSYRGKSRLINSERLEQGSDEVRGVAGAVWRINFNDSLATRVYVSATDGRVLAHRNSRWKLVDFLLMLHFMDYVRADSFNNPQIIVVGFGTLWIAISGLLLVFSSFSRSDFIWLPGMKSKGPTVNSVIRCKGQVEQQVALDSSLSFYASLSQAGFNLPSNCEGSGSCGLCKIRYEIEAPGHTAVDREWISDTALNQGMRLACQHKPRPNDTIVVPDITFQQELQWGEIVSCRWLTPLLKEIHLRPDSPIQFTPGDYLQFQVPSCQINREQLAVPDTFAPVWDQLSLPDSWQYTGTGNQFRTYSVATAPNQDLQQELMFTVRFSPPPEGTDFSPGIGSSYLCSLLVGNRVSFRGPAGDFRLIDSEREKILIGGGAGIAPLRSMALHLLKNQRWQGKLRFWYGARNQQEILYRETFENLKQECPNFEWEVALSDADDDQHWQGNRGFVHQVIYDQLLKDHETLQECEFYLCGPPLMLAATLQVLRDLGVTGQSIRFDDYGS